MGAADVYRECAQWTREQIRAGKKITSQQAANKELMFLGGPTNKSNINEVYAVHCLKM